MQQLLEPYGVTDFFSYSRGIEQYILRKHQFPPHLTYAAAADILKVDLSSYYKFAFVRNPWDRYVSLYEYFRKDAGHAMHRRCMSCSFEDFIDDVIARRATFDTRIQVDYVIPPPRMGPLDFIGKMENIENDFSVVCKKLGIENAKLPVLNTTNHEHYSLYYSNASKRKLEVFCEPDIKTFGYSF